MCGVRPIVLHSRLCPSELRVVGIHSKIQSTMTCQSDCVVMDLLRGGMKVEEVGIINVDRPPGLIVRGEELLLLLFKELVNKRYLLHLVVLLDDIAPSLK